MRSTLLALLGSIVLVASSLLVSAVDVDAKGKWPMVWKGDDKKFWSKPFLVANRPGLAQHHYAILKFKKKPGRDRCVIRNDFVEVGDVAKPFKSTTTRSRWEEWDMWWWWEDLPNTVNDPKKYRMQIKVRTNGNCIWEFKLWGPRKGLPPEDVMELPEG